MSSRQFKWEWVCQVPKKVCPKTHLPSREVTEHPLKCLFSSNVITRGLSKTSSQLTSKNSTPVTSDPLMSPLEEEIDPLSALAAERDWDDFEIKEKPSAQPNPWEAQSVLILNKYTTSKKISMATGIISEKKNTARDSSKHQPNAGIKNRLEQLDDFEEVDEKEIAYYTQQEYTENISQLSSELVQAWQQDFRVKALKITIQCSKLLMETSVVQFYPSKFVLVTGILDVFGNLVFERLCNKAEYNSAQSKSAMNSSVLESARETCRNWFFKIASIRELVPRLYVEGAVLKSYSFLNDGEFIPALKRLMTMTRGIGDPLVAIYTRCYLCRIGLSFPKVNKNLMKENFLDFLKTYDQLFSSGIQNEVAKEKISMAVYLNSFIPAIDWILKAVVTNADDVELDELVDICCKQKNKGLLLHSIFQTFDKTYIAKKGSLFIQQISSCTEDPFPIHILLKLLGESLQGRIVSNPEAILQQAWKIISLLKDSEKYFSCILAWNPFIVKHCSLAKLNSLLEDIIAHIGTGSKVNCTLLHEIIMSIVYNIPNLDLIFTLDKFLPLLDLFGNDSLKTVTSRKILDLFGSKPNRYNTTDPVTTDALIFLAKILHDSVNVFTVDDEKRQIGNLISQIITKIDYGLEMEAQLTFYVEARSTFTNLDSVVVTLIHCVNRLAMEVGKKVKSHHTRKTASFVHACAAYSFITIPSIRSEAIKLQLYLLTAQIALFNQCFGQADACIKSALSLILELPQTVEIDGKTRSNEPFLLEYIRNMFSTLIILPDCPDQGILYLTRGLVNIIQQYSNESNLNTITNLYLNALDMLATSAQEEYPYHVKKVDSNDILYGSDPKFINEINKMCSIIIDQILSNLQTLGTQNEIKKQAQLSFGLFLRIVHHADFEAKGIATLAQQLWLLAHNQGCLDPLLTKETISYIKQKAVLYDPSSAFAVFALQLNVQTS